MEKNQIYNVARHNFSEIYAIHGIHFYLLMCVCVCVLVKRKCEREREKGEYVYIYFNIHAWFKEKQK